MNNNELKNSDSLTYEKKQSRYLDFGHFRCSKSKSWSPLHFWQIQPGII